ncbi:hypothetical protein HBI56_191790 [Parastagonospora nodorum]|nr:hypothetical protein HBH56_178550 [Parastagonospora nodorum]KAH3931765.1 hypothetical protein HBH54_091270 [Parastagonospora nodorum]KAH3996205.1 hypothetical protein HBI10_161450 [Parastagonospora nodorum]KAH4019518.1 hypothetical protein HBI13_125810 [Parastagonospora nodorum]KAH4019724.1 hypothetical protein HBI09_184890 [Parastagonospora nodorum]
MNIGSSPYHAIGAVYCRASNTDLLSIEGRSAQHVTKHWTELREHIASSSQSCTSVVSCNIVRKTIIPSTVFENTEICDLSGSHTHVIRELRKRDKAYHVGLISCDASQTQNEDDGFREWLETFILMETSLRPDSDEKSLGNGSVLQITEAITVLFSHTLRNVSSKDDWHIGKHTFQLRVSSFVARGERIQMALPAFPCKSPSTRKVGGIYPDMAEHIALTTLHGFVEDVKAIYAPGVAVWIISDGHVFSDCIGVDDDTICKYDRALLKTYQSLYTSNEDHQAIRFRGLTDILFSNFDAQASFRRDWFHGLSIEHPICSKRTDEAELARMIMMTGFQTSKEHFRKLIADQHEHALKLYRGQARFMQDDLFCPKFLAMSTKQRKKTSFAVAAEMIARNQAYSNLLELLLPNYVRLSIHAHSNRGPKFGIRLFPTTKVRAIESIVDRHAICPSYEFQVPTPWHNSMIKIEGDDMLYLGKAEIVHKALEAGDFEGEWINDQILGGHFALRPTPAISTASSMINESISSLSTKFDDEKQTVSAKTYDFGLSPSDLIINTTKVRLAVRLSGKIHRMLGFSKLFAKSPTTDDLNFQE